MKSHCFEVFFKRAPTFKSWVDNMTNESFLSSFNEKEPICFFNGIFCIKFKWQTNRREVGRLKFIMNLEFSLALQYHSIIKHTDHENKRNDNQREIYGDHQGELEY